MGRREVLALGGIVLLGVLARILHLAPDDHYFILSADSYYFHQWAEDLANGEGSWYWMASERSGMVYPLAGLAKITSLTFASYVLPVLLGICGILGIYFVAKHVYSRKASPEAARNVALCVAFMWALIPHSVFITATGYLDRDGLSLLLITAGVMVFFIFKDRHWAVAGLFAAVIGQCVYWEWVSVGRWLMVASICGGFIGLWLARSWRELPWKGLGVLFVASLTMEWMSTDVVNAVGHTMTLTTPNTGQSGQISELRFLGLEDLVSWYGFFLLPLAAGIGVALKRRDEVDLIFLGWLLLILIFSIVTRRCLIYAIPAASVLAGRGLYVFIAGLREGMASEKAKRPLMAILSGCLAILIGSSLFQGYRLGEYRLMAPDDDWMRALAYIREETPEDALILNEWSYGYWVLDIAEREPLAKGGPRYEQVVASVYEDPQLIPHVMDEYNTSVFIFPLKDIPLDMVNMTELTLAYANKSIGIVEREVVR